MDAESMNAETPEVLSNENEVEVEEDPSMVDGDNELDDLQPPASTSRRRVTRRASTRRVTRRTPTRRVTRQAPTGRRFSYSRRTSTRNRITRRRSVTSRGPPARRQRAVHQSTAGNSARRSSSVFLKRHRLSPALSAVMGRNEMTRGAVVKRMHQLVRERNLQDPRNRQYMICDDELRPIFGCNRLRTFGMMKQLKNHFNA